MVQLNRDGGKVVNFIEVEGILAEKDLEYSTYVSQGVTQDCLRGSVGIKVNDDIVTLKVFANRLTKDGSESKAYKAMETVMNEHKSIAEVGEADADKVTAIGKLNPRKPFKTQDGKVVTGNEYGANFISRVKDANKFEPHASLTAEVYVAGYKAETKMVGTEVEETGRIIMKCVHPQYGGKVALFDAIIDTDEAKEFFEDEAVKGSTVSVSFDLRATVEKTEKKASTGGGFGKKPADRTFTKVKNEIVAVGADGVYEEYDEEGGADQKAFNPKAITSLLNAYKEMVAEVENSEVKPKSSAPVAKKGFGTSKPTPTTSIDDLDSDLPF